MRTRFAVSGKDSVLLLAESSPLVLPFAIAPELSPMRTGGNRRGFQGRSPLAVASRDATIPAGWEGLA
jgi:hypothetical protein